MASRNSSFDPEMKHVPSAPDDSAFPLSVPDAFNRYQPADSGIPTYTPSGTNGSQYYTSDVPATSINELPAPPGYRHTELREYVITAGIMGISNRAFASENAMRMYKEYSKLSRRHQDFVRAKKNQNQSIGLPLVISKRTLSVGIGDVTYLRFFECAPSPEARDRLYDKVDNRPIGEVLRRKFIGYTRYRLQIKGIEVVIIAHTRLPIVDLKINDERFRFVKALTLILNPDHFFYDLYLLSSEQTSLVDRMDSSLKVNRKNPILGGALHNLMPMKLSPMDRSKYISPHKYGHFEYHRSWGIFNQVRKRSLFSMYSPAMGSPDANNSVDFRSLMLLVVAMVLQNYEDDLRGNRGAALN